MIYLTLTEHPDGVTLDSDSAVVFDLTAETAHFGVASVNNTALVWSLTSDEVSDSALSVPVELDPAVGWLVRCDRIDFPPGGIAYTHTHPGPGIRRQLFGEVTVSTAGTHSTYGPGGAWFESGPEPVYAQASKFEDSAFVRALLLPVEWKGRRTIRYLDPEDESKPKLQKATVYLEHEIGVGEYA